MLNVVTTIAIVERQVKWIPKGWDECSKHICTVRDGKITEMPLIEAYFVDADPDGAIEFFEAIKRAKAESKK